MTLCHIRLEHLTGLGWVDDLWNVVPRFVPSVVEWSFLNNVCAITHLTVYLFGVWWQHVGTRQLYECHYGPSPWQNRSYCDSPVFRAESAMAILLVRKSSTLTKLDLNGIVPWSSIRICWSATSIWSWLGFWLPCRWLSGASHCIWRCFGRAKTCVNTTAITTATINRIRKHKQHTFAGRLRPTRPQLLHPVAFLLRNVQACDGCRSWSSRKLNCNLLPTAKAQLPCIPAGISDEEPPAGKGAIM